MVRWTEGDGKSFFGCSSVSMVKFSFMKALFFKLWFSGFLVSKISFVALGWSSSWKWCRLPTLECICCTVTSCKRNMVRPSWWNGWKSSMRKIFSQMTLTGDFFTFNSNKILIFQSDVYLAFLTNVTFYNILLHLELSFFWILSMAYCCLLPDLRRKIRLGFWKNKQLLSKNLSNGALNIL